MRSLGRRIMMVAEYSRSFCSRSSSMVASCDGGMRCRSKSPMRRAVTAGDSMKPCASRVERTVPSRTAPRKRRTWAVSRPASRSTRRAPACAALRTCSTARPRPPHSRQRGRPGRRGCIDFPENACSNVRARSTSSSSSVSSWTFRYPSTPRSRRIPIGIRRPSRSDNARRSSSSSKRVLQLIVLSDVRLTATWTSTANPPRQANVPIQQDALLLTVTQAAARLALGRSLTYRLIQIGALRSGEDRRRSSRPRLRSPGVRGLSWLRGELVNHLSAQHLQALRSSQIQDDVIAARGYETVETKAELGRRGFGVVQRRVPALLNSDPQRLWRPRRLSVAAGRPTRLERQGDQVRDAGRVDDAAGRSSVGATPALRSACASVHHRGHQERRCTGIRWSLCCRTPGVWNWRGTNGSGGETALPTGNRSPSTTAPSTSRSSKR